MFAELPVMLCTNFDQNFVSNLGLHALQRKWEQTQLKN